MYKKYKEKANTNFALILLNGLLIGVLLTVALSAVLSSLTAAGTITDDTWRISILIINLLSVLIATVYCCKKVEMRYVVTGSAISLIYLLLLVSINLVVFKGTFHGFTRTAISVMMAGILTAFIYTRMPKRKKKYKIAR